VSVLELVVVWKDAPLSFFVLVLGHLFCWLVD
jgi:hypothetical protein